MIASKSQSNPTDKPLNILHLEDSDADHLLLARALRSSGIVATLTRADDRASFLALMGTHTFDLVLMDFRLPGFTALQAWDALAQWPLPPPCVLVSGAIGEAAAVAAIQTGFSDYLHKNDLQAIGQVVTRALKLHQLQQARAQAARDLQASEQRITQLAHHLQTSLEQERADISREIHDDIGGSLAALRLDVAWIERHAQNPALRERAASAQDVIAHALAATQRIMQNTRPAILDQGLGPSVQWLTQAHTRRTGQPVQLQCQLDTEHALHDAVRLTAYRIVQEALTNISKHAPQAHVRVHLSDAGKALTVEVTDNGPGFDMQQLRTTAGFGLKGLGERAKNIGGWLDISSQPGQGTSLTLTAPLPPPPMPAAQALTP